MQQIAAIVVTYNRKEMLYTCISKLLQQESCACDILVIDNGSTDGTEAYIRSKISHPSVIYHNTGKNLGGAGGFSAGIQLAFQMGYSYIWLMDDDTYVERDSLEELLKADQRLNGNYGFLSSIAYWKDGKICNMNRQHTSQRKTGRFFKPAGSCEKWPRLFPSGLSVKSLNVSVFLSVSFSFGQTTLNTPDVYPDNTPATPSHRQRSCII